MKVLCLADLHLHHSKERRKKRQWAQGLVEEHNPDVIAIAGDVFEHDRIYKLDPYLELSKITDEIPIVCVLGNHEFAWEYIDNVLDLYREKYNPEKYNVHYLDVCGHFDMGDVRFVGNVLWYDGSTKVYADQSLYDWGNGCWLDRNIKDFNYEKESAKCVDQIRANIDKSKTNVLLTHHVPHASLNAHPESVLSAFSGISNLFEQITVTAAICGHTHKRVVGAMIEDVMCVNPGNDYRPPHNYYLLEI